MASNQEIPTVTGTIHISHSVTCPHCDNTVYDDLDRDWWNTNITDSMPDEEAYTSKYEVVCPECSMPFIIDTFEY